MTEQTMSGRTILMSGGKRGICINNASAIALDSTEDLPIKRFDLSTEPSRW